ncbi:MAG: DNA polymerase III subunit epsilon [Magnetococcales bacterium]|nr:DNA polymerase III subunit epsilon [Magnetococcales bacterium]
MERLIILDTETTGISPNDGHRIVEIGCIELVNYRKGDQRQWYLNPDMEIPREATKVHGITNEQVADAPRFADIADSFIEFIKDDKLVIHNASFDMGFLNSELSRAQKPNIKSDRAIDTLAMARQKYPGSPASLDALCRRFKIDNSNRTFHGALLDSELLAEVYIELMGGNQFNLDFDLLTTPSTVETAAQSGGTNKAEKKLEPLVFPKRKWSVNSEEEKSHQEFLQVISKKSGKTPIWTT